MRTTIMILGPAMALIADAGHNPSDVLELDRGIEDRYEERRDDTCHECKSDPFRHVVNGIDRLLGRERKHFDRKVKPDREGRAGVDREAGTADEIGLDAVPDDALEDTAKDIVIAETFVAGAREGGMIGDLVFDTEAAEPAIGEVRLSLERAPIGSRTRNR